MATPTRPRIRWAVLGCARIAEILFNQAVKDSRTGELHSIASRQRDRAEAWKQSFGFTKAYETYGAALEDKDADAVYIALPNHLHAHWAVAAAQAGKHILCEKPVAMNVNEAVAMVEAAKQARVIFTENFSFRFHPRSAAVRRLLQEGAVGEVKSVVVTFHNQTPKSNTDVRYKPDMGGGVAMDLGTYMVAFSRFIFAREPIAAIAQQTIDPRYGVDVSFNGVLDFDNGCSSTFATSFETLGWQTARILGTEGEVFLRTPLHPRVATDVTVLRKEQVKASGAVRVDDETLIDLSPVEPFVCVVDNIGDAIRGEAVLQLRAEESIANMQVLEACIRSAREGRSISVP